MCVFSGQRGALLLDSVAQERGEKRMLQMREANSTFAATRIFIPLPLPIYYRPIPSPTHPLKGPTINPRKPLALPPPPPPLLFAVPRRNASAVAESTLFKTRSHSLSLLFSFLLS